MKSSDPLQIHLSLVSHTNVGKTTLARTLLMRDVGEVADRAHVTETTDDYVLVRSREGGELILWDTPGFGDSVALARRLEERQNPIGWFISQVWDRFANKAFWLDQRLIRHIRDRSDVVLYLVNVDQLPEHASYIRSEMQILAWIRKPVLVLLNQLGEPRPPEAEAADVDRWREALAPYPFVADILPLDAFARCWVQERTLLEAIGRALPETLTQAYRALRLSWERGRQAIYEASIEAMAQHLQKLASAQAKLPLPSLKDRALEMAFRLGLTKDEKTPLHDAQDVLRSRAADSFCALTNRLLEVNGLHGEGVPKEIYRRMKTDWNLASYGLDPGSAAAIGAGLGLAGGAAAGAMADAASGGLSLGVGSIIGTVLGAVSGLGAAKAYNYRSGKTDAVLSWSESALDDFMLEAVLLYLAVAHYGRGRGDWAEGESPAFWKETVAEVLKHQKSERGGCAAHEGEASFDTDGWERRLSAAVGAVLEKLYPTPTAS